MTDTPPERVFYAAYLAARLDGFDAAWDELSAETLAAIAAGVKAVLKAASTAAADELHEERAMRCHAFGARDEARSDLTRMLALVDEILDRFRPSGSGHSARVGQIQIAKWRTRATDIAHGRPADGDAVPVRQLATVRGEVISEMLAAIARGTTITAPQADEWMSRARIEAS